MSRSRTFYAVLVPAVIAGGVLLTGVSSRADDDDDVDVVVVDDDGDDSAGHGTVTIATTPWAEVYLDGKKIGTTPIAKIKIPAGKHKLTLVSPDLDVKINKTFTIGAGESFRLAHNFANHGAGGGGNHDHARIAAEQARQAAEQARHAADQARQSIDQARQQIVDDPNIPDAVRGKVLKRLDKARKAVEKKLGNLNFNGDWDAFGAQMEAFGESMSEAFEDMDMDFADLGKDIEREVEKALKGRMKHGFKGGFKGGIHIDIDGDGDDDDMMVMPMPPMPPMPPVPPMAPMPPMPHGGGVVVDMSDMDVAIDLDSLDLKGSQHGALRQVIEDEQRAVRPAEEQLAQLSEKLREALENDNVDEQTINNYVDKMTEREAIIRKARLNAWAKARRLLDDDQRQQVQRSGRGRHGP
jgi:Spy/CpxP family protein refolding chaperone